MRSAGIEPTTTALSGRRSAGLSYKRILGAVSAGSRVAAPVPTVDVGVESRPPREYSDMEGPSITRRPPMLRPPTPEPIKAPSSAGTSYQCDLVEESGLEPLTPCLQDRRSPNLSYSPTRSHLGRKSYQSLSNGAQRRNRTRNLLDVNQPLYRIELAGHAYQIYLLQVVLGARIELATFSMSRCCSSAELAEQRNWGRRYSGRPAWEGVFRARLPRARIA